MTFDFSGKSSDLTQYAVNPLNIDSSLPNSTDLLNLSNTNKSSYDSSSYVLESQNIITGSTFTDNSGSNFIGDSNKPWDDAFIYAESGVVFNSIPTLSSLPGALTLGPDGTFNSPHQVADELLFPRSTQSLTIEIPDYDSLQSEALAPFSSTPDSLLNYFQQPLNTSADVESAFPSNDGEVLGFQVAEGSLNLPTGSRLHNLMITVENGDINFNGDAQELSNVTLVAKNGNVNLGGVQATGVSVLASGSINMNNAALFSGNNLLATKDGSVVFNGSTITTNPSDSMLVVANGNIIFNAAADTRANFLASGSFTANSASKIIGSVKTQGDIIFNAPVQVIADNIVDPNQPAIALIDTGVAANNPDFNYRRFIPLKDYVDNDNNPFLSQGEGSEHGTHIAGIIGATQNNGIGIDGINNEAPIYVSRAIGSGNWAQALTDSVDAIKLSGQPNGVVNLALDLTQVNPDGTVTTRYEFTPAERQALEYARQEGVLIVAAAGNDGGTMSVLGQASQEYDNIVTVGSVDYNNKRANYSSFGNGLDIVTYGGTADEPVLSTVGSGTDLKFLAEGLDELADDVEGFAQSIMDAIPTNFTDTDTAAIPNFEISDELSNFEEQAYKLAFQEVSNLLINGLDVLTDDLSNEKNTILASQVDFEKLLGKFESLNTLPSDFLNALNEPEVADLFALLGGSDTTADEELDLGVGEMAGTSVATAKVTGAVSQIWAANPSLKNIQIKEILKKTAVDLEAPGWDEETGAGLLNSAAAIELAKITQPESYEPEAFATPTIWSGEGVVQPTERAATVANESMGNYYDWVPYTVRPGDTLSEIASRTMGNGSAPYYNFIANMNGIANPNLIYAGETIFVPKQASSLQPQQQLHIPTVQGGIRQRWLQNLWLGIPTSGEIGRGNGVITQYFDNGYIIWNGQRATAYRTKMFNLIDHPSKAIAVPRRYTFHPRKGFRLPFNKSPNFANIKIPQRIPFLNTKLRSSAQWNPHRSTKAGIFDTWSKNWKKARTFSLDAPDKYNNYHLNAPGTKWNHKPISPKIVKTAGFISKGSYYVSKAAKPLALGLTAYNIHSAVQADNGQFGRNTKNTIGSEAGGWGGALAGAYAGGAIGTAIGGPVGTIVGAGLGLAFAAAGSYFGSQIGKELAVKFW